MTEELTQENSSTPKHLWIVGVLALTAVHNFILSNGADVMGNAAIIFSAVIFLIALGLWLYSRAMQKRGVLG